MSRPDYVAPRSVYQRNGFEDLAGGLSQVVGTLAECKDVPALTAVLQQFLGCDVELLFLARHWGARLVEVPVRWRHVEASRVQPLLHSAQMLRDLLWLRLRAAAGRLPPAPPSPTGAGAGDG